MQHGWLGDDGWFARNRRDPSLFRTPGQLTQLAARLRTHHVRYAFMHLCPCTGQGDLPPVDGAQTERLLDALEGTPVQVYPWIGGVLGRHALPEDPGWRRRFVASAASLLRAHPRLAGVHLNIEPWPSGDASLLALLDELRAALPPGRRLSLAAYPPPALVHPSLEVHWELPYLAQVAVRVDQVAFMMYDTALRWPKPYRWLVAEWTREVLQTVPAGVGVLVGLPAYDDAGVGYHVPEVEDLRNSLLGLHAGLASFGSLPPGYEGAAIYSGWEMDEAEWALFRERFLAVP